MEAKSLSAREVGIVAIVKTPSFAFLPKPLSDNRIGTGGGCIQAVHFRRDVTWFWSNSPDQTFHHPIELPFGQTGFRTPQGFTLIDAEKAGFPIRRRCRFLGCQQERLFCFGGITRLVSASSKTWSLAYLHALSYQWVLRIRFSTDGRRSEMSRLLPRSLWGSWADFVFKRDD